ncbi:MAG: hypothetical protein ACLFPJ_02150 [Candidatus Woesearchaeota archaeon]
MQDYEDNIKKENKRPKKLFLNEDEKPKYIPKKLFNKEYKNYSNDTQDTISNNFDEIIKQENINEPEIEKLYNFNNQNYPISTISIDELDNCVKNVGIGQKKLETIILKNNSKIYKYSNLAYNEIKKLMGFKKPQEETILDIFMEQQDNVSYMNSVLVNLIRKHEPEILKYNQELENAINQAIYYNKSKEFYRQKSPKAIQTFNEAQNTLSKIERKKDPEKYYNVLKNKEKAKYNLIEMRTNCFLSDMFSTHYEKAIDKMVYIHEISSNLMSSVKGIATKTKLYQEMLYNTVKDWQRITDLSMSVKAVSKGVLSLSNYHKQMEEMYIKSVKSIIECQNQNIEGKMIDKSLKNLSSLSSEVDKSMYNTTKIYLDK